MSDIRVEVRSVLTGERTVAMEVVLRGRDTGALDLGVGEPLPPTGRTIELPAVWICVVDETV